ncbi:hypothetical protein QO001_001468 [Methylobacterium brachiatum]|uniref:Uncharacterized protein n=1 Tax=Methylobacterium brachiatum TaxID=269660 RepID=A0AAJ1WVT4_9HYPH|nr:hypothetical protein [Methylobacterium brachiatum]MCB4802207.1 hypothetical protein [Methylobacterium brachiatum]MDQ0542550.1 hypothetical protein [Methylobacterium brachiatum]
MPRQFPRRRPGAIEGRLSDLVLALIGVLLLGMGVLVLLSWLSGDADGAMAGYAISRDS